MCEIRTLAGISGFCRIRPGNPFITSSIRDIPEGTNTFETTCRWPEELQQIGGRAPVTVNLRC
jgi:hypothetical protein